MIKPVIAVGQDSSGKPHLLYLGRDVAHATALARESGMEAEVYRKPIHFKRFPATATQRVASPVEEPVEVPPVPPEASTPVEIEAPKNPSKKARK